MGPDTGLFVYVCFTPSNKFVLEGVLRMASQEEEVKQSKRSLKSMEIGDVQYQSKVQFNSLN